MMPVNCFRPMRTFIAISGIAMFFLSAKTWAHIRHPDHCEHALIGGPASASMELQKHSNGTPLWSNWGLAQIRAREIEETVKTFSPNDQKDFALVVKAVQAAVTKHQEAFAHSHNWKKMDVPRHMEILRTIANFDNKKPKFSLYKIKRAIQGRHSLSEYVDCR